MKDKNELENKMEKPGENKGGKDPKRHDKGKKGITKEDSAAMPKGNPGFGEPEKK